MQEELSAAAAEVSQDAKIFHRPTRIWDVQPLDHGLETDVEPEGGAPGRRSLQVGEPAIILVIFRLGRQAISTAQIRNRGAVSAEIFDRNQAAIAFFRRFLIVSRVVDYRPYSPVGRQGLPAEIQHIFLALAVLF